MLLKVHVSLVKCQHHQATVSNDTQKFKIRSNILTSCINLNF